MARAGLQGAFGKRDEGRRGKVLKALYDLVCDEGYARTTLASLAAAAGMSPSHLLYYFENKEAVLVDLFELCAQKLLRDTLALPGETPVEQLDSLTDYYFGGSILRRRDQSFMLEIFGLATHDARLRRIKASYDRQMKAWLTGIFRRTPRLPGLSAEDAAEVALSTLVGLVTSGYFDETLERARERTLFRAVLRHLAGLDAGP